MSIVQEIMIRSADYLRRIIAPVGGQGGVTMSYFCPHCNRITLEDYIWCSVRRHTNWWCVICGEKYDWKQPNRLLIVQTGDSIGQAKVFKAHAVPQGLCANLINALKLLANQQEDGDGLIQNIVKNLGKESRKGLTDGFREFIKVDSERALDVGSLRWGTGTLQVLKPKAPDGGSDVIVRENSDELTLRAEELNTLKAVINVDHIEQERWVCQALYKRIEGEDREEMYFLYKEMSRAVVVTTRSPESKSPLEK